MKKEQTLEEAIRCRNHELQRDYSWHEEYPPLCLHGGCVSTHLTLNKPRQIASSL
jgi:hypothetical protein